VDVWSDHVGRASNPSIIQLPEVVEADLTVGVQTDDPCGLRLAYSQVERTGDDAFGIVDDGQAERELTGAPIIEHRARAVIRGSIDDENLEGWGILLMNQGVEQPWQGRQFVAARYDHTQEETLIILRRARSPQHRKRSLSCSNRAFSRHGCSALLVQAISPVSSSPIIGCSQPKRRRMRNSCRNRRQALPDAPPTW